MKKNIWVNYFLSFEKHNILLSVHFWSYFAAAILMSPIGVGMAMGEDSHINMPGKLVVIAGKDPENWEGGGLDTCQYIDTIYFIENSLKII